MSQATDIDSSECTRSPITGACLYVVWDGAVIDIPYDTCMTCDDEVDTGPSPYKELAARPYTHNFCRVRSPPSSHRPLASFPGLLQPPSLLRLLPLSRDATSYSHSSFACFLLSIWRRMGRSRMPRTTTPFGPSSCVRAVCTRGWRPSLRTRS